MRRQPGFATQRARTKMSKDRIAACHGANETAAPGTPATIPKDRRMTVTGDEPVSDGVRPRGLGRRPRP
jgi:hypothetical protein